jgi:hypothetical protein
VTKQAASGEGMTRTGEFVSVYGPLELEDCLLSEIDFSVAER